MLDSRRVAGVALLLLPGGLTAYFAFNSGGFYPGTPAYMAVVLSVVLLLRMIAAVDPLEGMCWPLMIAGGTLALYALWTLMSEHWSHAPGVAAVEYDRALLYVLAMALFGSLAHSRFRLVWMLRALAAAIVVVCLCGLITRVLPHLWPTRPNIANQRLSFPVTYWNALGLLAAFGIVLCVHFASDEREPPACKIVAAAAVPILATTLYFTFSRGSIAVCFVCLLAYLLVGRPAALASALVALAPTTAIALNSAYGANLLATPDPTSAAAVIQGRHVATAVFACAVGAGVLRALLSFSLDVRMTRFSLPRQHRRRIVRLAWGTIVAGAVIALIVSSGTLAHEYRRFVNPAAPGNAADLRARLTDPGNNGRLEMWRIAWRQFKAKPVLGGGAGTFGNTFAQHRESSDFVVDAHSLYMETLDELGVVGLVLLLATIFTVLCRSALRAHGPDRALYAAVFALLLAWALGAGIDWAWEMPVVTIIFFAVGGFVLARAVADPAAQGALGASRRGLTIAPYTRTVLGVGCLLLAVAPAYVWLSQSDLDQATAAFSVGDCRKATTAALSSISTLGIRAEPYEVVAFCDVQRDLPTLAIRAIDKAISLDPNNWNYVYGLALMRAAAGYNPLPAIRHALVLNPKDSLVREAWQTFSADTPQEWQSDGKTIADAFTSL